jgi:hypothetical protein
MGPRPSSSARLRFSSLCERARRALSFWSSHRRSTMGTVSQSDPSTWRVRPQRKRIRLHATSATSRTRRHQIPATTGCAGSHNRPLGTAIVVSGFDSRGLRHRFGRSAREIGSAISWSAAFSAEGIAAITYDAVDPITDLACVLLRAHARCAGSNWGRVCGRSIRFRPARDHRRADRSCRLPIVRTGRDAFSSVNNSIDDFTQSA